MRREAFPPGPVTLDELVKRWVEDMARRWEKGEPLEEFERRLVTDAFERRRVER